MTTSSVDPARPRPARLERRQCASGYGLRSQRQRAASISTVSAHQRGKSDLVQHRVLPAHAAGRGPARQRRPRHGSWTWFFNWDASLIEGFTLPSERVKMQFRGEAYNYLNWVNPCGFAEHQYHQHGVRRDQLVSRRAPRAVSGEDHVLRARLKRQYFRRRFGAAFFVWRTGALWALACAAV